MGNVETVTLRDRFDVVLSSLTLKHLYPTFEAALRNVARHLNPAAIVIFDLVEGDEIGFEEDGVTYVRQYRRGKVERLVSGIPLEVVALDEVQHDPECARLLVIAQNVGVEAP